MWCGLELRQKQRNEKPGDYGDGFFCGLRCAYQFAVNAAKLDFRFKPKESPPDIEKRGHTSPLCPTCKRALMHTELSYKECWTCTNIECNDRGEHWLWPDRSTRKVVPLESA